jgi:hypothetical protein
MAQSMIHPIAPFSLFVGSVGEGIFESDIVTSHLKIYQVWARESCSLKPHLVMF